MARRIPTIEVPQVADIPPGNITASEWLAATDAIEAASVLAGLLSYNIYDPADPKYGAVRGEVSGAQRSANTAAIQAAANDAQADGGILVIKGVFECDGGIQIRCHTDGRSGELWFFNTNINPAVLVGTEVTGQLSVAMVILPRVRQRSKTGAGWSGNDVGVRISNCNQCHIWVTHVHNFSKSIEMRAESGGCCYNHIHLGISENGKLGIDFKTGPGGWVNENLFIGGRFQINTAEGTNISGSRHIRVGVSDSGHVFNNNLFLKPSIEGNGPEYQVEAHGAYNTILQGRWESEPPKILWGEGAFGWTIQDGYGAHLIQSFGDGPNNCRITTRQNETWRGTSGSSGLLRLANSSSDAFPVLIVAPGGSTFWTRNLGEDYRVSLAGTEMNFKSPADSAPRLAISNPNNAPTRLQFGNGSDAPDVELYRSDVDLLRTASGDAFWSDVVRIGSRWYWTDSEGMLRKHTSRPSTPDSTSVGTVIG